MENAPQNELKLVFVGDGMVGKTCCIQTYVWDAYPGDIGATMFDTYSRILTLEDKD